MAGLISVKLVAACAYTLALAAFFGLVGTPVLSRVERIRDRLDGRRIGFWLLVVAAALLLALFIEVRATLLLAAVLLGTLIHLAGLGRHRDVVTVYGGAAVTTLVLSLAWWVIEPNTVDVARLVIFGLICAGAALGLRSSGTRPSSHAWIIAAFGIAGLIFIGNLAPFENDSALNMLLHHWSAYLGSAVQLTVGLVPFFDVPLQYGLGPTTLIAATCRSGDCWLGGYVIFVVTDVAFATLILAMALAGQARRGWVWNITAAAIVFAATFLWAGFMPTGSMVLATPSASGMRFLPVVAMSALWFFERPRAATILLVPLLLWSPESGAMSLLVFALCGTAHWGFGETVRRSVLLCAVSAAILLVGHRLIYGIFIDPLAFIEYLVHVPGPLPMPPVSDMLLYAAALGLALWLVATTPRPQRPRAIAVAALLFAAASYSFGRSHPNNICNLAPLLVLVGLRALDAPAAPRLLLLTRHALAVGAAAVVFSAWQTPLLTWPVYDIKALLARFPTLDPDVTRGRAAIPPTTLGIADFGQTFTRDPAERIVWTPIDPLALWTFVPDPRQTLYTERSARRLRRSGWIVVVGQQNGLLADFAPSYAITGRRRLPDTPGSLPILIACLDPKPEIAPDHIGPTCPKDAAGP